MWNLGLSNSANTCCVLLASCPPTFQVELLQPLQVKYFPTIIQHFHRGAVSMAQRVQGIASTNPNLRRMSISGRLSFELVLLTTTKLCRAEQSSAKNANNKIKEWAQQLLSTCDEQLASFVLPGSKVDDSRTAVDGSAERILRYLFTVGEVSQVSTCNYDVHNGKICPSAVPSRLVTVLQTLISPSPTFFSFLQESNSSSIGTNSYLQSVRAFAFIALGKLCLEDDILAKKCIPAFAKELENCNSAVVRNNVMVIMCDLCIK
jgi:condensin-2 complex subunit D3